MVIWLMEAIDLLYLSHNALVPYLFILFIYFIKTPEFEEMGTTYTYNDTDNIITHMNT